MSIAMGIFGILLAFAFIVWTIAVWTFAILATRPRYVLLLFLWLGVPALGLGSLFLLGEALCVYHSWPSVAFRESFGFPAPPDITFVDALRHDPIDWDDTYIEFYASDSTITRLLQDGFAPIQAGEIELESYETPDWWTPPIGPGVQAYATNTGDPHFSISHKLLIYDATSGDPGKRRVYFRYRRLLTSERLGRGQPRTSGDTCRFNRPERAVTCHPLPPRGRRE